ncbi:hypothetical protein Q6D62_10620 [Corynebacterium diphtheriae]|uniref:20kD antigen n=1 Tax=Corynebacterium diphtheriae TaxID=1717 RepID=Q8KKH5_CORDP|nr:hypothetical protein [Corynebacterium diphtheriae]AEX70633.1 gene for 20kD antigen [Corynebacterium diphtheriae PW8]OKY20522.1 hypothetical protein AO271_05550 [Corynebacterium diphtheriae]UEB38207.1 hypothetical protein LK425_07110 [Corynebacterium diphtheriae]WLF42576.1 hypothetical protein Q6D62_10620 [Corynebacterium diphtheriae]CAB0616243.1 hypothetical protein CIP107554_01999 [Corynebacterium diphtheriae]
MFRRSLASLAAVAVISGVVVAPANAVTVTVNNMTCTIKLTPEETNFIPLSSPVMLTKEKAAFLKNQYGETQLSALDAEIKKKEKELTELEPNAAGREMLTSELKEKKKRFTANKKFSDALDACIAGENYDSSKPNGPKDPNGPKKPGDSDQSGGSEKPNGPKDPGGSEKPNDPKHPEVERALPSTNGAVIGAIVAVLGILAAALPVIKSILRALLP